MCKFRIQGILYSFFNMVLDARLPFVEKYRPSSLDDVLSHSDTLSAIRRMLAARSCPHLLFYGPAGTGKTTVALLLAKQILLQDDGEIQQQVMVLNASDDRGIGMIRQRVKTFCENRGGICVLDEADMMTKTAQFALRRLVEDFSQHARFIIVCNFLSKIIPPLQSRCVSFRFGCLSAAEVGTCVRRVCERENVGISEEAEKGVVKCAGGDLRKALNKLQTAIGLAKGREGHAKKVEEEDV